MVSPCVDGSRPCDVGLPLFVARGLGLKTYFSGYRCDQGHRDFRRTIDKECVECRRVGGRRWKKQNAGLLRAREKERLSSNPEYRLKAIAKRRAKEARKYDRLSPEQRREKRNRWKDGWRERNPEGWRQYRKAKRARHRRRRRQIAGRHTLADIKRIYKGQKGRCAYYRICGNRLGTDYHEDHIVPIARGGTNDKTNIQLACGPCNLLKSAQDPVDFAQSLGLLL